MNDMSNDLRELVGRGVERMRKRRRAEQDVTGLARQNPQLARRARSVERERAGTAV